jgi:hypothetical protein
VFLLVAVRTLRQDGGGERAGGIHHRDDDGGARECLARTLDTQGLDGVGSIAQSRRVDKPEQIVADLKRVLDGVARGAVYVRYDCPVLSQQQVEQRGLARVGRAYNRYGDAILYRRTG